MTWYGVLKVVHVLSTVVWLGGGAAFALVTARLARSGDRTTLNALLPQVGRYMQTMAGPASGLVLITGIAMVIVGQLGFGTLWVSLGFFGIVVHGLFGALVMQKRMVALIQAAASPSADLAQAGARMRAAQLAYLGIMAAVVAVMVLKPTL